jgi:TatD DNase family protein
MHKVFAHTAFLKKVPAVVFHSWPGTLGEGQALIRRGVNVFFSFGGVILKNHREAMRCAALLPPERLLLETDAPYQGLRGRPFSSWQDLGAICGALAELRKQAGSPVDTAAQIETLTEGNFNQAFRCQSP